MSDNVRQFPPRGPRAPLPPGDGGSTYGGMEQRVARLEDDMKELKADMKAVRSDLSEIKGKLSQMPGTLQWAGMILAILVAAGLMKYFAP